MLQLTADLLNDVVAIELGSLILLLPFGKAELLLLRFIPKQRCILLKCFTKASGAF
jgi:hypothetical protein